MRASLGTALAAGAVVLLASCSSSGSDNKPAAVTHSAAAPAAKAASRYATAQTIADKLKEAGFAVSALQESDVDTAGLGMSSAYDFTISEKPGQKTGDSGINMFRSHEALTMWVALSKGFGGVAITGDTWAVSLSSDSDTLASSVAMAPHIAQVLGGTIQK